MKKTPSFNVGDKVFAKVKGYPPWPACVIAENGKKYNVKFYGTGETGMIKVEDISYYLKHKDKFQKPLKRKDYLDAFEQIEEAIRRDGGDGDPLEDSVLNDSNASVDTSNSTSNTSTKSIKKVIKRKRSVSDKSTGEHHAQSPKKRSSKSDESVRSEEADEDFLAGKPEPTKKSPKLRAEPQKSKDFEFVPINDISESALDRDGLEIIETEERTTSSEFSVQLVADKELRHSITYASHVKEKELIYKGRPAEPREDYNNQVLPIKLPSGLMGGIKLHTEWPLKFGNEYERAMYDEKVAVRVLETKRAIEAGNTSALTNPKLVMPNIGMTLNFVTECLYLRDIHAKRNRIDRLKIEADLMGIDSKIKNSLGLDKADPTQAITYLDTMCNLNFDELMLKKHPHVVDMVRRLRKYVGNTKEWNLSEESLSAFASQAEKIRNNAETVYAKFKKVVDVPEDAETFWDGFTDILCKFRVDCQGMSDSQVYLLCAEPTSRRAFFDHLDEVESAKENSSGVANSEADPVLVNGGGGTPSVVN